ncbi:hypothetical protein Q3G72_002197 [Acer saccharum]|nr:hypothetical protein Q3G72_002197 [Acer saccharum]
MLDALLNVEDEKGIKLEDDEIIDVLLMYLNAGHESSGATVFLKHTLNIYTKLRVHHSKGLESSGMVQNHSLGS